MKLTNQRENSISVGCGRRWAGVVATLLALAVLLGCAAVPISGQTAGEGTIEGTVKDGSGAIVPGAIVTATNVSTGVAASRTTTPEGFYVISPLLPGTYSVTATASGFKEFRQENFVINAMQSAGLDISLTIGTATEQVTVTTAPAELETTNAMLGGNIDSSVYLELPILVANNQQQIGRAHV